MYQVTEANWKDLPNIQNYIGVLEEELRQLQEKIDGLRLFETKLTLITAWKDGYPYRIEQKTYGCFEIWNLEYNFLAHVYVNVQEPTKYGLNTRTLPNGYLNRYGGEWVHEGHNFTLLEATTLAHKFVGFGNLKPRETQSGEK